VVKYLNKKKKEYYYPAAFLIWSSFNGCWRALWVPIIAFYNYCVINWPPCEGLLHYNLVDVAKSHLEIACCIELELVLVSHELFITVETLLRVKNLHFHAIKWQSHVATMNEQPPFYVQ
jgi:hypothetical protein